ncbi:MAG: S-methyl-5-thioribose-1-phosphate isomerase [Nitrospinae bacterium]|nr:S-methyl-5-thioribose-1-phosphate isomerase [Nitrospinota bacterium]
MIKTVEFTSEGYVLLIDQRILPTEEVVVECRDYQQVAEAIRNMTVRGAPAIGVTAAGGVALGAQEIATADMAEFKRRFEEVCDVIAGTRPTAVNLFWAVERMKKAANGNFASVPELKKALRAEADAVLKEDLAINETMGNNGAGLIAAGDTVLTHCNAGALATAGHFGTALGVIKAAHLQGKNIKVFADETRPFLQGARLTAWEMMKEGIDVTLITDNMAGHYMKKGFIQKVIVGADRIAQNGDTANKIGTYTVAVMAKTHGIPFYVAAPLSTIDFAIPDGGHIPIEERNTREVSHVGGKQLAPTGVKILNPAFDVTPNEYISAIITEKGVARAPFQQSLEALRKA